MCGIVGVWKPGNVPAQRVLDAVRLLRHRGPDGEGTLTDADCLAAHRRLSIVDPASGVQPLFSEDLDVVLLYNGEIYNHRALYAELGGTHQFRTNSDGEVLIHLYEEYGPACIPKLQGMFALAIVGSNRLVLARDPLGIKPLYWARADDSIFFASEIKALLPLCDAALIEEFPPGHYFTSDGGLAEFWSLNRAIAATEQAAGSREPTEWEEVLYTELDAAVRLRLMADVPVGVFLSGGLDSSFVAALMRPYFKELHSFAVGAPGSSDLKFAALAAKSLRTIHHEIHISRADVEAQLERIVYHLESFDPDLIQSAVPCYFVSREAAKHVKVVLTGEGADELFAGYSYYSAYRGSELQAELLRSLSNLHRINLQRVDRMSMAHGLEARVPFLDVNFVARAMSIPPALKQCPAASKYILRKTALRVLPEELAWRAKEQFDEGSGSAGILARLMESNDASEQLYRRLFNKHFPEQVNRLVACWRSERLAPSREGT